MSDDSDEPTLPRAGLNKLIKETVPSVRVATESRDLLYNCCIEFIHLISKYANDLCNNEQKKTISHEHVLKALEFYGFGAEYLEAADLVIDNCKIAAQKRLQRQNSRLENLGIPVEELLRQQQDLFEKAKQTEIEVQQAQLQSLNDLMASHVFSAQGAVGVAGNAPGTQQQGGQTMLYHALHFAGSSAKADNNPMNVDEDYDA